MRLFELLRLRVKDVDLERGQIPVYAGKGDKDRITLLPGKVCQWLQTHLDELRQLYQTDRVVQVPWVWLPEGLARKYKRAGGSQIGALGGLGGWVGELYIWRRRRGGPAWCRP
ncbi:MAG: tyrosine-type recombinase/integrase [Candidatus Synoicihabitans palmerolidicus]|nr:tyrosine-type recombinase/integrase [Candidatus Synoicihabitans palmerolidicus]